jgi:hypothetical protein
MCVHFSSLQSFKMSLKHCGKWKIYYCNKGFLRLSKRYGNIMRKSVGISRKMKKKIRHKVSNKAPSKTSQFRRNQIIHRKL